MDNLCSATPNKPVVERAFDLARSGECGNVAAIRVRLKTEGYGAGEISSYLQGRTIAGSLVKLCREALAAQADPIDVCITEGGLASNARGG